MENTVLKFEPSDNKHEIKSEEPKDEKAEAIGLRKKHCKLCVIGFKSHKNLSSHNESFHNEFSNVTRELQIKGELKDMNEKRDRKRKRAGIWYP